MKAGKKIFRMPDRHKPFLSAVIACIAISGSAFAGQSEMAVTASQPALNAGDATDRIIVKYKDSSPFSMAASMSATSMADISRTAGAKLDYVRRTATGAQVMKLERYTSGAEIQRIIAGLKTDPGVEYAEADLMMYPMATPDDTRYNEQWHYFEATGGLNLPLAWDVTQGTGSVVAVIDTGYRPHADLAANLLPGYDMISTTDISQDGDGRDSDASDPGDWAPAGACYAGSPASNSSWHGTHVAGTIAAVTNNSTGVAGVAYGAKIVPVRALGRCGGYTSDVADGMIWAAGGTVTGIAVNANPADVINLSLGGSGACATTTQTAIDTARSLGTTVVVAAGNSNVDAVNAAPANCAGVVTVASTDRTGGKSYFSNYGAVVDVAAPGGDMSTSAANGILSTLNSGTTTPGVDTYAFYQGTSMATPHVAGVAALLYAVKSGITPDEVETVLKSSARAFPATCSQCGSGIVDAKAAVDAASGVIPPVDTVLVNGVAKTNLSATIGTELHFTMDVPVGATGLSFNITGGTGDADLYVKFGSAPTTTSYDCRPYLVGNNETCNIATVQTGTYYVMVRAYSSFSGVSLTGSYTEGGSGGTGWIQTNLSGITGAWQNFTLDVPAGATSLSVVMSGGTGDADLYVRYAAAPSTVSYDCRPYLFGNNETCSFTNPAAGTWYISLYGYSDYSGVTLEANYTP